MSPSKEYPVFGNLEGKRGLVTGASEGIGRAIATALNNSGVHVALLSRSLEKLQAAQEQLPNPKNSTLITADALDQAALKDAVQDAITHLGGLDIVVNNAGGLPPLSPDDPDFLRDMMVLNVVSMKTVIEAAIPELVKTKGVIINTGSVVATQAIPHPVMLNYAAAKAAVHSLTASYGVSLAPKGVRVVGVGPGTIDTEGIKGVIKLDNKSEQEGLKEFGELHPLGRVGQPAEVANVALFLASPYASFITGHTVYVDGGINATTWLSWPQRQIG